MYICLLLLVSLSLKLLKVLHNIKWKPQLEQTTFLHMYLDATLRCTFSLPAEYNVALTQLH